MKNACSRAPATAFAPALHLQTIWDVNEGPSYDVQWRGAQFEGLIAIRTWTGVGRVFFTSGKTMDLRAGTVVVLRNQEIVRYRCEGPQWKFWWFEFTVTGASLFPVGSVIDVPRRKGELQDFRAAFLSLRRRSLAQRTLATACFSVLLSHWMARTGDAPHARHEDAINGVIDTLMDRLECGWPIGEMAAAAGMSERAFRTAFHEVTGLSPKTFYDHTRLTLAEEMLKLGAHNVSEIAGRLGYSSPFHFSKAFKQKYGIPPARMLNRENGRASSEQA